MRDGVRLRRGGRLADIGIERWFGDAHQCTDILHRDRLLLIELHCELAFVRRERLGASAEAPTAYGQKICAASQQEAKRNSASSSRRQSSGGCQPAATHSRLTMTAMT